MKQNLAHVPEPAAVGEPREVLKAVLSAELNVPVDENAERPLRSPVDHWWPVVVAGGEDTARHENWVDLGDGRLRR